MSCFRTAGAIITACAFSIAVARAAGALHPGDTAPPITLAKATSPGDLSLSAFRGKPVYLNFFASWCGPCVHESPYIGKLAAKYASKGLVTLGIDELEDRTKAAAFATANKLHYPVLVDKDGQTGTDYGQIGLPMHVFIDKQGKIALWRPGEMSEAEIEAAIQRIL
jgi:cytochrome c biogenesis protein CcmG/thiol:disulfide interchange protein DsbE